MVRFPTIVLATNNAHKLGEMVEIFAELLPEVGLIGLAEAGGPFPDAPEDGETFAANAEQKARWYARQTGLPTLADDSGICVDCLGGRPGIHSARYAATAEERIEKLLREIAGQIGERDGAKASSLAGREAHFACVMALVDPATDASPILAEGRVEGAIMHAPVGAGGFGYDPVFWVPEFAVSMAELSSAQKHSISHRGRAAVQLARLLGATSARRAGE